MKQLALLPDCVPIDPGPYWCFECGEVGEGYMVRDEVWLAAVPWYTIGTRCGTGLDFLCLACLAARIGRPLVPGDFTVPPGFELDCGRLDREWFGGAA